MAKRRGNGEGSIYQLADGRWRGCVTTGYTEEGKRRRQYLYGKTKREVQEKLIRLQGNVLNGVAVEPDRVSLADYLNRWVEDTARLDVRHTTYRLYRGIIRNHINPNIGGVKLAKVNVDLVQGLYSALEKQGVSPRVRQLVHAVLHNALRMAVSRGSIQRNPCDVVKKPRVAAKAMQVLDQDQVDKLLEAAHGDRLYALYLLAVTTGLRQGELLALQWQNVDLKRGVISVQHTLQDDDGKLVLSEPKSAKSRRRVDLPQITTKALKRHREALLAEGHPGPWVFCDRKGGPIRQSNLTSRSFKPLLRAAGLPDIRFHDLRHTAATLMLALGVSAKVIQEMLGHSNINLTFQTYAHVLPSLQHEAATKIDTHFSGGSQRNSAPRRMVAD